MSAYAGDVEGVLRWGEACEELCPDRTAAAPFWCWYAQAAISRRGPEAGRAVIERGLRHHPRGLTDVFVWKLTVP